MFQARRLPIALAVALLSGACAMDRSTTAAPAAPDTAPGATLLEGLGSHSFPVTSHHPAVPPWFHQGLGRNRRGMAQWGTGEKYPAHVNSLGLLDREVRELINPVGRDGK